jgi:hypothetical protein
LGGAVLHRPRGEFDVREMYAETDTAEDGENSEPASMLEADARTRTEDPFITSEVLYQLSYVGKKRRDSSRESISASVAQVA